MEFTDPELAAEIRTGSIVAFERLVHRYRERVYRIAYGFARDRDVALEVAQDTWVKVHASIGGWRGDGSLFGWIARIAAHQALNRTRFERRRPSVPFDVDRISRAPMQAELLMEREASDALHRSLSLLAPKPRLAIILRYFLGLSSREMATVLECTEGTARNLLFRSLERMRSVMAEEEARRERV